MENLLVNMLSARNALTPSVRMRHLCLATAAAAAAGLSVAAAAVLLCCSGIIASSSPSPYFSIVLARLQAKHRVMKRSLRAA